MGEEAPGRIVPCFDIPEQLVIDNLDLSRFDKPSAQLPISASQLDFDCTLTKGELVRHGYISYVELCGNHLQIVRAKTATEV